MTSDQRHSPDATVRYLMRSVSRASLATLLRDGDGAPYASLAVIATDMDGAPLLLLSDLADHTRNLQQDGRASLLLQGESHSADPLADTRVTLMGQIGRSEEARHRARYLRRHPDASLYAGFKDFSIYRFEVERAHLVAGFGRIHWLPREQLLVDPGSELPDAEPDILEHMNQDHADAIGLYATKLLGRSGEGWSMTGIDAEGSDLRNGTDTARLTFPSRVNSRNGVRSVLVSLVNEARKA